MAYDNSNSGFLARNDKKQSDKHPDFRGAATVAGTEYWLSGWVKEGKPGSKMAGQKFFSLSLTPKDEMAKPAPAPVKAVVMDDFSDDIPF
ncbi:hypothetical protein UFOVP1304_15 [uncultured Caudovirales phage]|uniref:Uncharacterized protein n=1 Tax=uncultured Caudovirales phage TaxID=2100421 RepID=A0A6J5RUB1_9CAUD|nr:hypothetical protein UFOVP1304_15 [uncultured Caudovirales phage]